MYIDENDIRPPVDRAPENDPIRNLLENTPGRSRAPLNNENRERSAEPMPRVGNDISRIPETTPDCCGDYRLNGFPLAMVYSPIQKWQKLYDEEKGFTRGTIFAELDKPFEGRRRK